MSYKYEAEKSKNVPLNFIFLFYRQANNNPLILIFFRYICAWHCVQLVAIFEKYIIYKYVKTNIVK